MNEGIPRLKRMGGCLHDQVETGGGGPSEILFYVFQFDDRVGEGCYQNSGSEREKLTVKHQFLTEGKKKGKRG